MASFSVTLRADKVAQYPVLLSNGNLVDRATWTTAATSPSGTTLPEARSYLFALVAGDWWRASSASRTRSGQNHLLQVWVRPGDLDKTEHAMNSLIASSPGTRPALACRSTWSAS